MLAQSNTIRIPRASLCRNQEPVPLLINVSHDQKNLPAEEALFSILQKLLNNTRGEPLQ